MTATLADSGSTIQARRYPTLQAAIDAAYAAGGGTVQLAARTYSLTGAITLKAGVYLLGQGSGATILSFTDLGAGVDAITMQGFQDTASRIEGCMVKGPGTLVVGVQSCNCDGIVPGQSARLTDVQVQGFRAGLRIINDHHVFDRVKSANNYYNVLFDDSPASKGNMDFLGCYLEGACFACVAALGSNNLDFVNFVGGNCGNAPYGFYKANGPTTGPSSVGLMSHCRLDNFAFEGIGNAAIWDESTGAGNGGDTLTATDIINPGFVWDPAYKIGARAANYAVKCRNIGKTKFINGQYPFTAGAVAAYSIATADESLVEGAVIANMFDASCAPLDYRSPGGTVLGRLQESSGTIAQGDLLEWSNGGPDQVRRYTGSSHYEFAGVALAAGNGRVLMACEGQVGINVDGTIGYGAAVKSGSATAHHAIEAPGFGFSSGAVATLAPIVGVTLRSGTNTLILCRLFRLHDRGFVQPVAVTALPAAGVAYRGQMLRVEGGAGVADTLNICEKNAANAYVWRAL